MVACSDADRGSPALASGLSEVPFYSWFGPTGVVHQGTSPRTVVCDDEDQEAARNSGLTLLIFDGSEWLLLGSSASRSSLNNPS
jgi:hypothetical protein